MKSININNTICNYDLIMIDERQNILLFNYYNNSKTRRIFMEKIFNNTSVKNDIHTINTILNKYGVRCVETRQFDNVYIYDIVSNCDIKNEENIEKEMEDILNNFDYDFILHNKENGTINLLKYNNHKRIKKDIKSIVARASSIAFVNLLLNKYDLKCYLVSEYDNIRYYEIISFTEYNKRNKEINKEDKEDKEETSTLDLSDLD